jgi:hypothetical protein
MVIQIYRGNQKIGEVPVPRTRPSDFTTVILVNNLQDVVARGVEVKIHAEDFDPDFIALLTNGGL